MSDLFSLKTKNSKRALITGPSQVIGFALGKGLADAGAEIVLNGRDTAKLDAAAAVLEGAGAEVRSMAFETQTGAIDILVNNAGMQHRTELENFPADAFERLLQIDIASVFHVGQGSGAGRARSST